MPKEESNIGFLKNIFAHKEEQKEQLLRNEETSTSLISSESLSVPMKTRTVDWSHKEVLVCNQGTPELHVEEERKDLDIEFAGNFVEKGGKFIYCETFQQAVEEVRQLAFVNHWQHVYVWENEIRDAFNECEFQKGRIGFTLEKSDAMMCLCEELIADKGNIVLNPAQASRRKLPIAIQPQIFIADLNRICSNTNRAIDKFNENHKGELPSIIDLSSNTPGQFYYDGNLVLKAHGTMDVYLILIDETITRSKRA